MSIKKKIKNYLPNGLIYRRDYRLEKKKSEKTYREVEKELNDEFRRLFSREIDWDNPQTYNEKLNISKLYDPTELKARLTDKIQVVDWVKEQLGNDCNFIPLLATYDSVDDINFSNLPKKIVIKMNSDSGSVFLHDEKHPITKDIIKKYKYYFQKRNYAFRGYEMHYKDIQPKIMIEEYMGSAIRDYKFLCLNGKVHTCRVDFNRFGEHTRNFYDKNWNLLPFNKGNFRNYPKPVRRPINFEKMWKMAEILGKNFDQVRVDFYDIDNKIYFGEMTFTNGAGFERFNPDEVDLRMGKLWKLDMDYIRKRRAALLKRNAKIGE